MIYTVTFNPSLDYIVTVNNFEMGMTNRTSTEQILPGGKGINVSTVLHNLGIETTALGFVAGFTGEKIEKEVEKLGFSYDFIHIPDGFSRINMKIKNVNGTEINGMGPDIPKEAVDALMAKLDTLKEGDGLVLAGSIPASLPDSIYSDIMARLEGRGITIVVDATRDLLLNVLKYHPFMIKPNIHELGDIYGVKLQTKDDVIPYAKKLQERGAQNVIVSMGVDGAVLLDADGKVHKLPAAEGKLVNAVGAGDSMVAGFIAGYEEKKDYAHAFRLGSAAGSASALSELLETKPEIEALYKTLEEE